MPYNNAFFTRFKECADEHLSAATTLLETQKDMSFTPYHSKEYHLVSLVYPVCHALKIIVSAGRIIQGGLYLLEALVVDPSTNIPNVLTGMAIEAVTMIFNAINVIASTLLIVTRTLTSVLHFGYIRDAIAISEQRYDWAAARSMSILTCKEEEIERKTTNLTM